MMHATTTSTTARRKPPSFFDNIDTAHNHHNSNQQSRSSRRSSSSPTSHHRLNEIMREKLLPASSSRRQRLVPELFGLTSNLLDRMCCCSYVGAQAAFGPEVPEMAYSFGDDECSILASASSSGSSSTHTTANNNNNNNRRNRQRISSPVKVPKEVTTVCSQETTKSEQTATTYCADSSIFRGWSEDEEARMDDCGTVLLDGSRGVIHVASSANKSSRSKYHDAGSMSHTTARSSSSSPTSSQDGATLRSANSKTASGQIRSGQATPREITLPRNVNTKSFVPRRQENRHYGLVAESRQSLPEAAVYQDSRRIRQVQSESLAELPYLSMTEGYEC